MCPTRGCESGSRPGLLLRVIQGRVAVSNEAGSVEVPTGGAVQVADRRTAPAPPPRGLPPNAFTSTVTQPIAAGASASPGASAASAGQAPGAPVATPPAAATSGAAAPAPVAPASRVACSDALGAGCAGRADRPGPARSGRAAHADRADPAAGAGPGAGRSGKRRTVESAPWHLAGTAQFGRNWPMRRYSWPRAPHHSTRGQAPAPSAPGCRRTDGGPARHGQCAPAPSRIRIISA